MLDRSVRVLDRVYGNHRVSTGNGSLILTDTNAQIYIEHRPRYPRNLVGDLWLRMIGDRDESVTKWRCGARKFTLRVRSYFSPRDFGDQRDFESNFSKALVRLSSSGVGRDTITSFPLTATRSSGK